MIGWIRIFWKPLFRILGFLLLSMKIIMHCVSSSRLFVLWNGSCLLSFTPSKGLRQRDLMSPYLFMLCMGKLAVMVQNKVNLRIRKPLKIARNGPCISHLLFANDVLLFCNRKKYQVQVLMDTMIEFCNTFGLSVNFEKSRAMAFRHLLAWKKNSLSNLTSICFINDIGRYLGIPILKGRVTRSVFNPIVEKISLRLATWKRDLLNKAGRVCLIKSVIFSTLMYPMQT